MSSTGSSEWPADSDLTAPGPSADQGLQGAFERRRAEGEAVFGQPSGNDALRLEQQCLGEFRPEHRLERKRRCREYGWVAEGGPKCLDEIAVGDRVRGGEVHRPCHRR